LVYVIVLKIWGRARGEKGDEEGWEGMLDLWGWDRIGMVSGVWGGIGQDRIQW
jgi:hypothetical protein